MIGAQLIPEVVLVEKRVTSIIVPKLPEDARVAVRCDGPFPKHLDYCCSHIRNFVTPIPQSLNRVRTPAESDRTLRDGSLGVAIYQALRARLRSHCPQRDKRHSPVGGFALGQRLWGWGPRLEDPNPFFGAI